MLHQVGSNLPRLSLADAARLRDVGGFTDVEVGGMFWKTLLLNTVGTTLSKLQEAMIVFT